VADVEEWWGGVTGPPEYARDGDQGRIRGDMLLLPLSPGTRGRKTERKAERNKGNFRIFAKYYWVGATDISTYCKKFLRFLRGRGAGYSDQRKRIHSIKRWGQKDEVFLPR